MNVKKVTFLQVENFNKPKPLETIEWVLEEVRLMEYSDLILLPELWVNGAFDFNCDSLNFNHNHLITELQSLLKEKCKEAHLGSYVVRCKDGLTNQSLLSKPSLGENFIYDKRKLFGFGEGESGKLNPGHKPCLVPSDSEIYALSTCFDLRFPEIYSEDRKLGATTFLCAAGWPKSRIEHWKALATARAIENQSYFIGCNASGTSGGVALGGNSIVVNPNGEVLFMADSEPGTYTCELQFKSVAQWREAFPIFQES